MDGLVIALTLLVFALAIAVGARRLRSTPTIGAAGTGERPASDPGVGGDLLRSLETGTTGKQILSIQMRTIRSASGDQASTETITIDGQIYHSVEEIPADVRERVRAMVAKARATGSPGLPQGQAGLARIEHDLATLGLDLTGAPDAAEGASETASEGPPKAG